MNTRMHVIIADLSSKQSRQVFETIKKELFILELLLSRFDPEAQTFKINQNAYAKATSLSLDMWEILALCDKYKEQTLGYFDICYTGKNNVLSRFELDIHQRTIKLLHKEVFIDFGAIGKGIALQSVSKILEANSIENALVSFGESSVLTKGKHPNGDYWPFAFQHKTGISQKLQLNDDALSISGLQNGKGHIINPKTGALIDEDITIAVRSENPIEAEVLSTALIAAPKDLHPGILSKFKLKHVISNE